ncbi:hypothetical protein AAG570_005367 [Ranatra chinensis]|uniref:ISXO2-like transposase domain-containing protein n=1 Tax=Ranatra chinensis TaxID=642074 RepID=A0ABD0YCX4_9HEMI
MVPLPSIGHLTEGKFYLENHSESIGGPRKIVQIDEGKFGRRNYNRGHFVEGQLVLGGIERDTNKMFLVAVHDRSSQTLTDCMQQWVLPSTTIHTDCWIAYDRLGEQPHLCNLPWGLKIDFFRE